MLNRVLLILCVLIMAGCARTIIDSKPIPVTIDFSSRSIKNMDSLQEMKTGRFYQVRVDGINLNLYKIKIGNTDSSTSEPFTFPTFATLPIDGLQKVVGSLSSLGNAVNAIHSVIPESDSIFHETMNKIMIEGEDFKMIYPEILEKRLKQKIKPEDEVKVLLLATEEAMQDSSYALETYKKEIDSILYLANQSILNAQVESGSLLFGSGIPVDVLLKKVTQLRQRLDNLSRWNKKATNQFSAASEPYRAIIDGKPEFKKMDEQLKKAFAEFEPVIAAVKSPLTAENSAKLFTAFASIHNNSSRCFTSLPIQFTKEQALVDIEINPRNESSGLQSYKTTLVFPTETMDTFWGFSSGFFVSIPANEAYSTVTNIGTDTTYSVISEKPGKAEIGFNTMLRYGNRIKSNFYWQMGIGPGLSVADKVRPRMLLGTGFSFGEKHALLIDAGVITGYYDVKSQVYNLDEPSAMKPDNIVVSKLKAGGYFSIGYIFLK